MKYAVLFNLAATLLGMTAAIRGGLAWVLLWPTASLCLVGIGYIFAGPGVYGKRQDGTLPLSRVVLLLPYLALMWTVWHLLRHIKLEDAFNTLADGIIVGRRLLPGELSSNVATIADLTCEFPEAKAVREAATYLNFPILDGHVPDPDALDRFLDVLIQEQGTVYIHCAEGHGRTALVTASLLLKQRVAQDAESAIQMIQSVRPLARLGATQRRFVQRMAERYRVPDG